jgi:cellulose synthase/poly-beta-1,6-N-acetylglucosamine synthase-like glycosyltransferase
VKITAMIPVYREPKRVGDMLAKLLACDYPDTDVIVVVDGPTNPAIESALEAHRSAITVHYNGERLGKTESLNRVAFAQKTDAFLMLDNDIELPDDPLYLRKLAVLMETADIVEIPKEAIRKKPISRMMAIEFLSNAMLSMTMAKLAKRTPSMNGAAFASSALLFRQLDGFRPVMNEDMDFAVRAFQLRARFAYPTELKVRNEVPDTVHDWLVQRKRWATNNILWVTENFFLILANMFKTPAIFLSSILMTLPLLTYTLVFFLAKHTGVAYFLPLVFMVTQNFHVFAGILLWLTHIHLVTAGGWLATGAGLLVAGAVYAIFARILRFRLNPIDFLCYYFFYSPILIAANVIMLCMILLRIQTKIDWKVTG